MRTMKIHSIKPAFTLVELLVVVLILGAQAFVAIPRVSQSSTTAKINACDTNVETINRQSQYFFHDMGAWPQNWNKFEDETDYFPDGPPECPFGDTYNMDGGIHHVNKHSH